MATWSRSITTESCSPNRRQICLPSTTRIWNNSWKRNSRMRASRCNAEPGAAPERGGVSQLPPAPAARRPDSCCAVQLLYLGQSVVRPIMKTPGHLALIAALLLTANTRAVACTVFFVCDGKARLGGQQRGLGRLKHPDLVRAGNDGQLRNCLLRFWSR